MTAALVTKTYNKNGVNAAFVFREDGWFNMTKAAKVFGVRLENFVCLPSTAEYAMAVAEALDGKSRSLQDYPVQAYRVSAAAVTGTGLIVTSRGRNGGTWAHPKLAVFFARWLDVKFAVWCDSMIEDILKGAAEVTITRPADSAVMALPQDFPSALRALADAYDEQERLEAEATRAQAEATRAQAEATRAQAEATRAQAEAEAKALEALELNEKLELAAPSVEFVEHYVVEGGNQNLTAVAKLLEVGPRAFVSLLLERRVLYRAGAASNLLPYQVYLNKGFFALKATRDTGGIVRYQTLVTPKGVLWLSKRAPALLKK